MATNKTSSTRLKIVIIAVGIAILKEVAMQFGVEVTPETYYSIEGMLLALAGLDTVRPLGQYGDTAVVAEEPTEEPAEEVAAE